MVGHGGSSAGSYLADPTSPIPSDSALIVATSTLRVNIAVLHGDAFGITVVCYCNKYTCNTIIVIVDI